MAYFSITRDVDTPALPPEWVAIQQRILLPLTISTDVPHC